MDNLTVGTESPCVIAIPRIDADECICSLVVLNNYAKTVGVAGRPVRCDLVGHHTGIHPVKGQSDRPNAGSQYLNGNIAEIVHYTKASTDPEWNGVVAYPID